MTLDQCAVELVEVKRQIHSLFSPNPFPSFPHSIVINRVFPQPFFICRNKGSKCNGNARKHCISCCSCLLLQATNSSVLAYLMSKIQKKKKNINTHGESHTSAEQMASLPYAHTSNKSLVSLVVCFLWTADVVACGCALFKLFIYLFYLVLGLVLSSLADQQNKVSQLPTVTKKFCYILLSLIR